MNCIFCCIFNDKKYINKFNLFLENIRINGNLNENMQILVYTSTIFMNIIKEYNLFDSNKILFEINDSYDNINMACKARADLFNLPSRIKYERMFYLDLDLDTDIIINDDILKLLNIYNDDINIYDVKTFPQKNTSFSLIGLCVSYNYFDTLQFMLPINYLHFEKIYLITQEDDIETIEFCKKYNNVIILFYDFKNNNKIFDKFGALNYAQSLAYEYYPNSWYLIIDSDIILPNNFIDILNKEKLNPECIYGAIRNNVSKSSELLNKLQIINNNKNWIYNNIIHAKHNPPCIIGCFQLYKKQVYNRSNIVNAGQGDYYFGHDNFNIFCNFENILYFHLGPIAKNWYGKMESFIDDINISLNDIYYKCHKKLNNKYYNEKREIVKI